MVGLTQLKSDYIKALEKCIKDCQGLIASHRNTPDMHKCVEQAQLCINVSAECLEACEAARIDRGMMMHRCIEVCQVCARECEKHSYEESQRCAAACRSCIEEFKHMMA